MQHVPEVCISICGAVGLVAAVLLVPAWRKMRGRQGWRKMRGRQGCGE